MDELDYKILLLLKTEPSLTRAAEKLHTTQPSLSYRIKQMEDELDVTLFARGKRGIRLTPQGAYLIGQIEKIFNLLAITKDEIKSIGQTAAGRISIGVANSFSHYELPTLLKAFNTDFPLVSLDITADISDTIQKMMRRGSLSVGLLRGNVAWDGKKRVLFSEPICIASSKEINLKTLDKEPYIRYNTASDLHFQIDYWWKERFRKEPNRLISCNKMDTCLELVKSGFGWSILPAMGLKNFDGCIENAYFLSGESLRRETVMCSNAVTENSIAQCFIDFVERYYHALTRSTPTEDKQEDLLFPRFNGRNS